MTSPSDNHLTSSESAPWLRLERRGSAPLSSQLLNQLREGVRSGVLRTGVKLPSTRALARELDVSRPVVGEAYAQLAFEGYLHLRQGARPVVAKIVATDGAAITAAASIPQIRFDLRPAIPDLAMFPREAWLRALRSAITSMTADEFGYQDRHGNLRLREVLADYLGRVRGIATDAEQIIITSGFAESRALFCSAIEAGGARRVAVECPSYDEWTAVEAAHLERVPVEVDASGLNFEALASSGADAVFVMPAHQFPTGVVMTSARRRALVDWLREGERFALEDDYDAEFRYDVGPIGALKGLAPDRVAYAGTTSKTLAPAIRLGWFLPPAGLIDAIKTAQRRWSEGPPRIDQLALAHLIESGAYERHVRRMRKIYRGRRDRLVTLLRDRLPQATVEGVSAGLHLTVGLPTGTDVVRLCRELADRGIAIESTARYGHPDPRSAKLLLGYGRATEGALEAAVGTLAEKLRALD